MYLSHALKCGAQPNPKTLRLAEHNISFIDIISVDLTKCVENLYLSGNYLKCLTNIDQFNRLVSLSLSNNLLVYLEDLNPLRGLFHLTKLSLVGNDVVHMPYYTEHVVSLCLNLQVLDDAVFNALQRAMLQSKISEGVTRYKQLLQGEIQNALLRHLTYMAQCRSVIRTYHRTKHWSHAATGDNSSGPAADVIYHQLVLGGVQHWLQLMSERDFSRLVQVSAMPSAAGSCF